MPFFKLLRVDSLVDAIKNVADYTTHQEVAAAVDSDFRLYELLKNSQRSEGSLRRAAVRRLASAIGDGERELVEDDGIEPTTPCLQSRCSPS